jgi:segregation and condensation protein B
MTISSQLEAILFVADKPLSLSEIAKILEIDCAQVETALLALKKEYEEQKRGIRILVAGQKAQLVSAPEYAPIINRLVIYEKKEMTRAKIEALTILAYQGPLTKEELETMRGVNCSVIVKNLLFDELVDEMEDDKRVLYSVSAKFLKGIAITSVKDLPDYEKLRTLKS